jgi:hypothetical protein
MRPVCQGRRHTPGSILPLQNRRSISRMQVSSCAERRPREAFVSRGRFYRGIAGGGRRGPPRGAMGDQYSGIPPPPAGSFFFSGISLTMASVVSSSPATLAAFWRAIRSTFVGTITPALTRSV